MTPSSTFLFDPRDLICPPFRLCPRCATEQLGISTVGPRTLHLKCRGCWNKVDEPLPSVKKKIVYLDQFAISNMFLAVSPEPTTRKTRIDPYWRKLFGIIDALSRAQVLICPEFENHRLESTHAADLNLNNCYTYLSHGVRFLDSDTILHSQLLESLDQRLSGASTEPLEWAQGAISGDVNAWLPVLRVVLQPRVAPYIASLRSVRARGETHLKTLHEQWAQVKLTFDERVQTEQQPIRDLYLSFVQLLQETAHEQPHLRLIRFGRHPYARTVLSLAWHLERKFSHTMAAAASTLRDFFEGPAMSVPYHAISSAMWAQMGMQAAQGQKRPPNRGTFMDVRAASTLIPVCDSMFLDDACVGLLRSMPKQYRPKGAILYSTRTKGEFLSHLEDLKGQISSEHLAHVERVYGPDWETPNLSWSQQSD